MKTFKVETFESHTHSWEGVHSYKPEYVFKRVRVARRWWFRFFKKEALICINPAKYEKKCEHTALHHAKMAFHHAPARLQEITILNGYKAAETLWMNGKWVHYHHMPIKQKLILAPFHFLHWLLFGGKHHHHVEETPKDTKAEARPGVVHPK